MARMGMHLLCVGHVALDLIFCVHDFPAQATKTPAHRHHRGVGGMSGNAAQALARLGAQVRLCAPVGDDASADVFEQVLRQEGVELSGLRRVPGATSSVSSIIVDRHGERMIFNAKGSALDAPGPFDPAVFEGIDFVLVDPRCPTWAEAALAEARRRGIVSMLDGEVSPRADLQQLVPLADWRVFSEQGLLAWADEPTCKPEALMQRLVAASPQRRVVCTRGARGVQWCDAHGALQSLPAIEVGTVVDTLGAGDVFHAALALALAEGQAEGHALRFASAAAALKCSRPDGIAGAPQRAEVEAVLACAAAPEQSASAHTSPARAA
ncbi:MAG: sugar kinase [Betaproteobacteria bacterium]|nr:sugar kinase [Betaproteobacteria bacterium]